MTKPVSQPIETSPPKSVSRKLIVIIGLIGFSLCLYNLQAELPDGTENTQEAGQEPPTPEESVGMISLPEGFHLSLFAGEPDVAQPIAIEYDDRGRLWVLESFSYIEWKRTGKDRLLIFEDTDNDGRFDKRTVFWDQGNHTSGFQIGFGGVWLCDAPELLFIPDANGDDVPDGKPKVVLDGWTTHAEHNFFNGLTWGPDGWLYGRHGIKKPSKVGKPGSKDKDRVDLSCCIWRYHPVKDRFEVLADGTINPWGLDWNEEGEGFINTSVIDHLWHLVPGARYERTPGQGLASLNPHTYDLMVATSDHRHWSGGETGRKDFGGNHDEGGGHSHCGMVIYQSDAWPEAYRGKAFFSNVLGQRINVDALEKTDAAWVATHQPDFLKSSSEWFRAVDLKQGPYGEMMIAEWTDLGECHDRDGIHRTSGRLYEIWHGERPERKPIDVASSSTGELLGLLNHENVWWRRHALRNLHERFAKGERLTGEQVNSLIETAKSAPVPDAITAMQALHRLALPAVDWVHQIYDSAMPKTGAPDERAPLRIHLLTLALTEDAPSPAMIDWFEEMIPNEQNPAVRYRMAALLQRLPVNSRWTAAELLTGPTFPQEERNAILMRWYGFEPLVAEYPEKSIEVALEAGHPYLSRSIARRAVAAGAVPQLLTALQSGETTDEPLGSILSGMLEALPARADMPKEWEKVYAVLKENANPAIRKQGFQLAQRFGDPIAEAEMVARVMDGNVDAGERLEFLEMLISSRSTKIAGKIPDLIAVPELSTAAIRAEAVFPTSDSAKRLIDLLTNGEKADIDRIGVLLATLASRKDFSDALVETVLAGEFPKEAIPSHIARQVAMISSKSEAFATHLGMNLKSESEKVKLIETWKERLSEKYLADADAEEGREVFRRICMACHVLYGEGGKIGPDLTGSGRADLDYVLLNVLFPSDDVSPDYRLVTLTLKDGRTLTGNIAGESGDVITFRQVDKTERIDASEVVNRVVSEVSLMPPGLFDNLNRKDVRDLIGYLRTKQPLP